MIPNWLILREMMKTNSGTINESNHIYLIYLSYLFKWRLEEFYFHFIVIQYLKKIKRHKTDFDLQNRKVKNTFFDIIRTSYALNLCVSSIYDHLIQHLFNKIFHMHHKCMASLLYGFSYGHLNCFDVRKSFHMYHKSMVSLLYESFCGILNYCLK